MSWVEAAWTVKRIEQDLEIPMFINSYVNQINTLNNNIIGLGNRIPSDSEIQTIEQTSQTLTNINQQITTANRDLNTILTTGQAFIDIAINGQPNEQHSIRKNTVWFISEV